MSGSALGFNPQELRARYRRERDKRLRVEGVDQFPEIKRGLIRYLEDPNIEHAIARPPLTDNIDVAIVGAGFGGILAGAHLRTAGVQSIRILEKAGAFGGAWYWNRYPGLSCDIESYIYLPLLEETGYIPSEKYISGEEVRKYSEVLADRYGLSRDVCFQTEVTQLSWAESSCRWVISTNRGDQIRARFVVLANGPLHRPKLPGIDGIESYKGVSFHTSRWNYEYTGGDHHGNLSGLRGKSVGIVGTGATAVQCVPHLAAHAEQLFIFQRTPSTVDVRNNAPTDRKWFIAQSPGWQRDRMENFEAVLSGGRQTENLVADGWTDIAQLFGSLVQEYSVARGDGKAPSSANLLQIADFQKMEAMRQRVVDIVSDESTAECLKPYYNQFCKRPCFHDTYLETFNRRNVALIDTYGKGIQRITEHGVVVDGQEYPVDCLIFATGFEVTTAFTRRAGYEVHGSGGLRLSDKWAKGYRTFHGMHVNGFPNCFVMGTMQSGYTANYPHALSEQAQHLAHIVLEMTKSGKVRVEANAESEQSWVETNLRAFMYRRGFLSECTPGYFNHEGKLTPLAASFAPYGAGALEFFRILRDWRESGGMRGLRFS